MSEFAPEIRARRPDAIIIAGSAGGVEALVRLLAGLPETMQVPVICMLHMPASRDSRLAELFAGRLPVPVLEAADKQPVADATVYFAGSGYHLSVEQDRTFSLSCEPPVHFARPAIDVLMTSAADVYGRALAAILLTGANTDGAEGMAAIHARGGLTVVQDPREAQVPTMPQAAIDACVPDLVLPLARIHDLLKLMVERT
ncbi:chemotaxis protein CheB [Massilia sp. R2A-15]|uniref:chemotaxis protein CheB n=1 Tax=Massilia sp. R2A-15 TaxID=3064278 RepID=UPI0027346FB0|nr:chemotaxis protein CheB [Massilia sp. R2A-15]WLI87783.1 chemotaxis protein CheB [Massilia sp. R2A-15]